MRDALDPREQARVESLLRSAAEFEPARGTVPRLDLDLAQARRRRGTATYRWTVPAFAVAAAGCILLAGLFASRKKPVTAISVAQSHPNITVAIAKTTPESHLITAPVVHVGTHTPHLSRPRPRFAILPLQRHTPRINWHARIVRATPEGPRVRWHNETVVMVARGVMTRGWMVHADGSDDDAIVAEPAVLSTPIQSAELAVRHGVHVQPRLSLMGFEPSSEENP